MNEDGVVLVDYEALGKHWLKQFKRRQKNLRTERLEKIEAVRNEVTKDDLEKWFVEELTELFNEAFRGRINRLGRYRN